MAIESQKARIERAGIIVKALELEYPDSKCSLNFTTPLELLVATILSAQCTDIRVNIVTPALFAKYGEPEDYYAVPQEELGNDIRSTGFFNQKSKSIQNCCRTIVEKHNGEVPNTMDELVKLAGVGRKTANVLLGNVFGVPGLVVDTHVKRLSGRLGLTKETNPDKIESDLNRLIPEEKWTLFSHHLVDHGRKTCNARKPDCGNCVLIPHCPYSAVQVK